MNSIKYYLPGSLLIFIAITIVAFPEILVAFIGALIIMAGIGALIIGHRIKKSETKDRDDGWFHEDNFYGQRFAWRPIFRRW